MPLNTNTLEFQQLRDFCTRLMTCLAFPAAHPALAALAGVCRQKLAAQHMVECGELISMNCVLSVFCSASPSAESLETSLWDPKKLLT